MGLNMLSYLDQKSGLVTVSCEWWLSLCFWYGSESGLVTVNMDCGGKFIVLIWIRKKSGLDTVNW